MLEVENGESLVDPLALKLGARREDAVQEDFVALDVVLDQALLGGNLEELLQLQQSDSLDVNRSAQFVHFMVSVRVKLLDFG